MRTCPNCGHQNTDNARFCSQCATPLAEAAPTREERKVVTCLFCDLVGFTARAERMDPEDVRRLLQPYHARVRTELERFGGTVEKFIGDAVMAVFGAPVAHEDDPERAVRAALAIREALAEDGDQELRIGITTGEALIALDARPETGEGMASGDVVNTAARLQAAAVPGSILVDEKTYRATEAAVEYVAADPVEAKGKAHPVAVWQAATARLAVGADRLGATRLVGRGRELQMLNDEATKAFGGRQLRMVTLVGVAGIGKSRLVREHRAVVENEFGDALWLRGRSPSYGGDVSFSAFRDIVKTQAGILESDSGQDAASKLADAVAAVLAEAAEAEWVRRHIAPVLGIEGGQADGADRRPERFAAWRRYLEGLATAQPLVLVFEDLHWADDAQLDFVASLADWLPDLPVLVLATSRPELLEHRPDWTTGERRRVIALEPLSDDDTAELITELLAVSDLPAETRTTLLEQSGGNPLFAEQYVRMVAERGAGEAVPQTVQALIVARLDALPEDEKRAAQDASVIGGVFWSGAVAAAGGQDRWTVEERLRALERRALLRRSPDSTVADETEWVFGHALVRDAAYAAIPRASRAERHLRVAEWVESLGRADDHAELVAHHYSSALELASAAGLEEPEISMRTVVALKRAGDRAASLHSFSVAARFYRRALDLSDSTDDSRPRLLLNLGRALWIADGTGQEELLAASAALQPVDDREGAAEAEALLVDMYWASGRRREAAEHLEVASALVDELDESAAKAQALCFVARTRSRASDHEAAARIARNALALAEALGLDEVRASALAILGGAELELDEDVAGFANLEASIESASSIGSPEAIRVNSMMAHHLRHYGYFSRSVPYFEEALELSGRYGNTPLRRMLQGMLAQQRYRQGRWDEALAEAQAYLDEVRGAHYHVWHALQTKGVIRLSRGDARGMDDVEASIEAARSSVDPGVLSSALAIYGRALVLADRTDEAREALDESLALFDSLDGRSGFDLPYLTITAFELGVDPNRVLTPRRHRKWVEAARFYFAGDFGRAADVYHEIGTAADEAESRLRWGRALLAAGKHAEGAAETERSLEFYRPVGAKYFVRQGEAALADAGLEIPA